MCTDPNDPNDSTDEEIKPTDEETELGEDSIEENEFPPDSEQIYAWKFFPDVPF